jgi:hypothetical protein
MKKLSIIAALALGMAFCTSDAFADLLLVSSPNVSFNFDTDGNNDDSLNVAGGDGLSDMAIFLGYRQGFGNTQTIELTGGTAAPGAQANTGSVTFDTVGFTPTSGGAITLTPTINFELFDVTGVGGATGFPEGIIRYDMSIVAEGVNATNQGQFTSFVGFDFNGNGQDRDEASPLSSSFGPADREISDASLSGASSRSLYSDFTLQNSQTEQIDVYDATTGTTTDLASRFNSISERILPGGLGGGIGPNVGFGALDGLGFANSNATFTTEGVVGFVNVAAATIPEPSSLALAAIGFGLVAFRRKRRGV